MYAHIYAHPQSLLPKYGFDITKVMGCLLFLHYVYLLYAMVPYLAMYFSVPSKSQPTFISLSQVDNKLI